MTIPYPNTQPMPTIAAVTPPSGAPRPRVTFLGTGYLGATYAICYAELGYEVLGFDVDADKIAKLNAGEVPIHEPGLDELLRRNLAAGRLRFTTDIAEAADFGDVHFICVGTPQRADGMGADLSLRRGVGHRPGPAPDPQGADRRQVHRAGRHRRVGRAAGRQARPRRPRRRGGLEPRVPPGGLRRRRRAAPQPDRRRRQERVGQRACSTPRTRASSTWPPPRTARCPLVVTDFATAELVKVAANAFLATKISFINAMAEVCEASGGDVTQLARAHRLRPADRQPVPPGRRRLRRRLPAQGHPRVPGPRPGARRRRGAALPARGRPDQPAPPDPGRPARRRPARPPLRPGRPGPVRHRGSPCSARPSSPTPTTSATRRRSPSPRMLARGRRRRARLRPAGHGERRAASCPS